MLHQEVFKQTEQYQGVIDKYSHRDKNYVAKNRLPVENLHVMFNTAGA